MTRARASVFPHAERYAVSWLGALGVVFFVACLVSTGCAVPAKAREQLRIDAAAADRVAALWPALTPEKREAAYLKLRRGVHVLRYSLTDELPADAVMRAEVLELGGAPE